MGCDIHFYVEKQNEDGQWVAVKGKNPDINRYRGYATTQRERGNEEQAAAYEKSANEIEDGTKLKSAEDDYDRRHYAPTVLADWAYDGRNYNLFAILADVRNGRGFAGSYTGEGFNPIAEPKGIPNDLSPEVTESFHYWEGDGHSHSWFTLQDLLDYDWDQNTKTLKPGMYRMDTPLEELQDSTMWVTYKECAGEFYTETIPKLNELAGDNPDKVRIVFWFDN